MEQEIKSSSSFSTTKIEIIKIRATVLKYFRQWLDESNYLEVATPVIVKHPILTNLSFNIRYFDRDAFISHNNQLYLETAAFSVGNAWTLNPSFRSEKKETERHLSEFVLLQIESLNLNGLDNVLQIQENLILNVIENTIRERIESFNFLKIDPDRLKRLKQPFQRMRYDEAIKILREKDLKVGRNNRIIRWGDDLDIDAERELTRNMTAPLFITHFPMSLRPFYIKHDPEEERLSLSVDMLAPEGFGEITSGGLREDDVQRLKNELRRRHSDEKIFDWYCKAKMKNLAPHGGFGLGIDRLVRWLTLSPDIRDVMLFPRTPSIIEP